MNWVIINSHRKDRSKNEARHGMDQFDHGNEDLTPPEVDRIGDARNWQVRVIPNKYPITDIHEIIVYDVNTNPELVFDMYKKRYLVHRNAGRVIIFVNVGPVSGATVLHPHSQLTVVPNNMGVIHDIPQIANIIVTQNNLVAYCSSESEYPYEVWIRPQQQLADFAQISDQDLHDLSQLTQNLITKIKKLSDSYNYYLETSPNWYLRIFPRLTFKGGFELATGIAVNIIDPASASQELLNL